MPIFEYKCQDCGTKFEKLVRGTTTDILCPSCGKDHLEQELSTFSAHANGGSKSEAMPGACPSGMCRTPGLCGRN
jgi:putative FmdB family regulatory protein